MQQSLDFTKHHGRENNQGSQNIYDLNLDSFNRQCRIVLEQLLTGRKLTFKEAFIHLGISDLRRRAKDLKDIYNIPVKDRTVNGNFKEWYLEMDFIDNWKQSKA